MRINGLDTHYMYRDVVDVMEQAGDRLDTILIPKVGVPADVYMVDALLTQIEEAQGAPAPDRHRGAHRDGARHGQRRGHRAVQPPRSRRCISASPTTPRASARAPTSIGGLNPDYPGDQWHFALSRMIVACRAYGLRAIDGPFGDFTDPEGYTRRRPARRSARRRREVGDPSHADRPGQRGVHAADRGGRTSQRILDALEEAEPPGTGAAPLDGKMIDAASARMAQNIVNTADSIHARRAPSLTLVPGGS